MKNYCTLTPASTAASQGRNRFAQTLLKEMNQNGEYEIETLNLEDEDLKLFTGKESALRESLTRAGNFEGPLFTYAKQFAAADRIVVAAPYWDFSFPARMKCYLEQICVTGLTFTFSSKGIPGGLCHADSLHYVTTSGGSIGELNLGYEYLEKLCKVYYGINETVCYTAEGLDIEGNSVEEIMKEAEEKAVQKYRKFTLDGKL